MTTRVYNKLPLTSLIHHEHLTAFCALGTGCADTWVCVISVNLHITHSCSHLTALCRFCYCIVSKAFQLWRNALSIVHIFCSQEFKSILFVKREASYEPKSYVYGSKGKFFQSLKFGSFHLYGMQEKDSGRHCLVRHFCFDLSPYSNILDFKPSRKGLDKRSL